MRKRISAQGSVPDFKVKNHHKVNFVQMDEHNAEEEVSLVRRIGTGVLQNTSLLRAPQSVEGHHRQRSIAAP